MNDHNFLRRSYLDFTWSYIDFNISGRVVINCTKLYHPWAFDFVHTIPCLVRVHPESLGRWKQAACTVVSEDMVDPCFSLLYVLAICFPTVFFISLAHNTGSVVERNSLQGCSEDTVDAGCICASVCTGCAGHVMCAGPVVC